MLHILLKSAKSWRDQMHSCTSTRTNKSDDTVFVNVFVLCSKSTHFNNFHASVLGFICSISQHEHSQESNWGETKQIPPFLSALWPKRFSVLQRPVKCSESPEEDRDKWVRKPKREGPDTEAEHDKGKTARVEWYLTESKKKPKVLLNGAVWGVLRGKVNTSEISL